MIRKILKELWDIFNYFCHLETMRFCDKYERYYLKKEEEIVPIPDKPNPGMIDYQYKNEKK